MSKLKQILRNFLNIIWPKCPSGLDHRIIGSIVTNCNGREYCWHRDCFTANSLDVDSGNHECEFEPVGEAHGKSFERCTICEESRYTGSE